MYLRGFGAGNGADGPRPGESSPPHLLGSPQKTASRAEDLSVPCGHGRSPSLSKACSGTQLAVRYCQPSHCPQTPYNAIFFTFYKICKWEFICINASVTTEYWSFTLGFQKPPGAKGAARYSCTWEHHHALALWLKRNPWRRTLLTTSEGDISSFVVRPVFPRHSWKEAKNGKVWQQLH